MYVYMYVYDVYVYKYYIYKYKLYRIFNKNTIKVSYSCMTNMCSVLSRHNKKILSTKKFQYGCNCRSKTECPLDNNCLTKNYKKVLYSFGQHIISRAL